ncbi:MAG: hypothetical protein H0W06_08645 [Chloroflexia bacterium]|nr:hypothetical protein [Chloroflexia bacterium]
MEAGSDQAKRERPTQVAEPFIESRWRSDAMDGTQGRPGKREVDLYVRTYMTLLESSGAVAVSSLEPAHLTAASSLHAGAAEEAPDMSAFLYSAQRIPACMIHVRHVVLGQSHRAFRQAGLNDLEEWEAVSAPGRRRRWHFDGWETLAAYIASASDLDDLIPSIVAYQLEWNKLHRLIEADPSLKTTIDGLVAGAIPDSAERDRIGEQLSIAPSDWARLQVVWGTEVWSNLGKIAADRKRIDLRMLGGTYLGYARSTRGWWRPVNLMLMDGRMVDRPIYFVSSNTHSVVNVLSGVAPRRKDSLTGFIRETKHPELLPELEKLEAGATRSSWDNLLYFAARHFFHGAQRSAERQERQREEEAQGIHHFEPTGAVDVGIQVIELAKLDPASFDSRLEGFDPRGSDALIVNINYPLGLTAYHIMSQIGVATDQIRGIYILGKAATLNGRIGDIMMANVVYDEHSGNTYWFDNIFDYEVVSPWLLFGAALDNQKAVTVKGTFLQNQGYLDFYYRENYTVVEMEAGPYLSAIYEDVFLERHPTDQAINLTPLARHLDLGIIHYASDTPYTRAQTLGARGLSYYGMDSTYASTIAILRRIFALEADLMGNNGASIPESNRLAQTRSGHRG